jgi:signal transduction histidine kinase
MSIGRASAADERSGTGAVPRNRTGITHQIAHDIHHELSTITLLASLICSSKDVGTDTHRRAEQMLSEIAWLEELLGHIDSGRAQLFPADGETSVRLDDLATTMVSTFRLAHATRITADIVPARVNVDRLALWRLIRNLMGNAVAAAGPDGTVHLRVRPAMHHVFLTIDDDGPGFGLTTMSGTATGLGIVRDVLTAAGGRFSIGSSGDLGGCRVRVTLPRSATTDEPVRDQACV